MTTSWVEPPEVTPYEGEPESSVKLRQFVVDGYDGTLATTGNMRIGGLASELATYIDALNLDLVAAIRCNTSQQEIIQRLNRENDQLRRDLANALKVVDAADVWENRWYVASVMDCGENTPSEIAMWKEVNDRKNAVAEAVKIWREETHSDV